MRLYEVFKNNIQLVSHIILSIQMSHFVDYLKKNIELCLKSGYFFEIILNLKWNFIIFIKYLVFNNICYGKMSSLNNPHFFNI